jgi:hypothetical protein
MKRLFMFVAVMSVLICGLVVAGPGTANALTVSLPQNQPCIVGNTVDFAIIVSESAGQNAGGYAIRLSYDTSILTNPVAVASGTSSEGKEIEEGVPGDGIGNYSIGVPFEFGPISDGVLIKVRFTVADSFIGARDIIFSEPNTKTTFFTAGFVAIPATWENGSYFITGLPTGAITLTPDPVSITADGISTSTITSSAIKDAEDDNVPDGTKITVATSSGTITTADADGAIPGIQVLTSGGLVSLTLQSGTIAGTANVTVASVAGDASGQTAVIFSAGAASGGGSEISAALSPAAITADQTAIATVQFKDQYGNLTTDLGGAVLATNEATLAGASWSVVNNGNGTATATYTPGAIGTETALKITLDGVQIGADQSVTVTPGVATGAQSEISAALSPATITADDTATATILFKDKNGNPTDSLGGLALEASGAVLTGATWEVVDNGDGTATATYTPGEDGAEAALQITLGGAQIGADQSVTVNPGVATAAQSVFAAALAPETITADATATATVQFKDQKGNNTDNIGGRVLAATGATLAGATWTVEDGGSGTATATYTPSAVGSESALQITLGGAQIGANQSVTVTPGAAVKMTLTASRTTLASDTKGNEILTARILDKKDNLVTTDNTTQVTFTLTDVTYAEITGSPATAVAGEANATVRTTAGTVTDPPGGSAETSVTITSSPELTPPAALLLLIVDFSIQVNAPAAPFYDPATGIHLVISSSTPSTAELTGEGGDSDDDYRWELTPATGGGSIDSTTAKTITFTAPATAPAQKTTLTLRNAAGTLTDTIDIFIYNPVAVTWPTAAAGIAIGDNSFTVTASGGRGAGTFEFKSSDEVVAEIGLTSGVIEPKTVGEIEVEVGDDTYGVFGDPNGFLAVTQKIEIVNAIKIVDKPTLDTVESGAVVTFSATGGKVDGEVNWEATSGLIDATGKFTAPVLTTGSQSVKITAYDKTYNKAHPTPVKTEYTLTVLPVVAIMEKPTGYVEGQPATYPLLSFDQVFTLSASDETRSYEWVVTDWNDDEIPALRQVGGLKFDLDPNELFDVNGAGIYTVYLYDQANPDYPAVLNVRIPMRFYSDTFDPDDSGTYPIPPWVVDEYGADGGPAANVYFYGIYDLAGNPVADGVYGTFADASPTGDGNVFTFAAGIETLVSFRVKVSLDPASADADAVRLIAAGLDEVWSGIFRIVPVVAYSGKVVELNGVDPVVGADVVAIHDLSSAVTTDGNGEFTTPGFELTGVTYKFLVRMDGYVDKIVTAADIEAGPIVLEKLDVAAGAGVIGGNVTLNDAAFSGIVEVKAKTADGDYVQDAFGADIVHIANPLDGSYSFPVPANFAVRGPFDVEFRRSGYIFDAAAGLGVLTGVVLDATDADIILLPVTKIYIAATPQDTTIPPDGVFDEVLVEIEAEAGAVPEEFAGTAGEIKVTVTGFGDAVGVSFPP